MPGPVAFTTVEIDLRSPVPSYIQLANWLRDGIEGGKWRPGEPVPSITELVEQSGLAKDTVRRAVKVVADEGLVHVVSGRGTFVAGKKKRERHDER